MAEYEEYHLYSSVEYLSPDTKRAYIDLDALKHNWHALCHLLSKDFPHMQRHIRPIAVVKADAYGHGAPQCVRALLLAGCDFFAVSSLEEALAVRRVTRETGKDADILIFGYTAPAHVSLLAAHDLTQTLLSASYANELADAAEAQHLMLRTHIALNTGMNRIGFGTFDSEELQESVCAIEALSHRPSLRLDGMYTHFATADEGSDFACALFKKQIKRYSALRDALAARGISIPFHHICNSAATLSRPDLHLDGVRAGILLYGAIQSPSVPSLLPVMRVEADIVHVYRLSAGECVGYGADYVAKADCRIAVLPMGYADGLTRSMSGATVTIQTKSGMVKVPIVGRICMDQCMLDVTDTDVSVGDTATIFGNDTEELLTLSEHAKTIPYEVLCLISSRVKRIYKETATIQNKDTL